MDYKDATPEYWLEYTNIQKVKHDIIREYLNGWFPKLALGPVSGTINYFDTHAGRGTYKNKELGSPLVALKCFLDHEHRERILKKCNVEFHFIERDQDNFRSLESELAQLGELPKGVKVNPKLGNSLDELEIILEGYNKRSQSFPPSFVFIDPYGFKVPCDVYKRLMANKTVELFINVIWRELNMGIIHGQEGKILGWRETLDYVFGSSDWMKIKGNDIDERAEQAIEVIKRNSSSKWATHIRMLGDNNKTRYFLMHLTNNDNGRELMKDCIWKVCPEGGYFASKRDAIGQEFLFQLKPDFKPLKEWVVSQLSGGAKRWSSLSESLHDELWRQTHLNQILKEMKQEEVIRLTDPKDKFTRKSDPLLELSSNVDQQEMDLFV